MADNRADKSKHIRLPSYITSAIDNLLPHYGMTRHRWMVDACLEKLKREGGPTGKAAVKRYQAERRAARLHDMQVWKDA